MKDYADLISAIASLLWPAFAFTALFVFKAQIANLIGRLRRGKLLGQEIELAESLENLEKSAVAVAQEVAALPAPEQTSTREVSNTDDPVKAVLHEAAKSPKTALILLATEIEREARQLLASVGQLKGQRYMPLSQAMDVLGKQYGGLPSHVPSSLKLFWDVRNRIIHGGQAESEEILRAIDSGVTILKALQAFPREVNVVHHPGVTVYRDPLCQISWPDVRGVILETESPGGAQKSFRIFPTTKDHFRKGQRVAWEWSDQKSWGEAWYKVPETGETKIAWSSAMEFVGRPLDEV